MEKDDPTTFGETVEVVNDLSRLCIRLAVEVKEYGWGPVLECLTMIAAHVSLPPLAERLNDLAKMEWPDNLHDDDVTKR
jgi:hypothetical protein